MSNKNGQYQSLFLIRLQFGNRIHKQDAAYMLRLGTDLPNVRTVSTPVFIKLFLSNLPPTQQH